MEAIGEQLAEFGSTAGTIPRVASRRVAPGTRRPFASHDAGRAPARLSHLPMYPAPADPAEVDTHKTGEVPADQAHADQTATDAADTHAADTDAVALPADDPLGLAGIVALLAAAAAAAPDALTSVDFAEAAHYAAHIEELSRCVESLQVLSAGAVDRARTQAITSATAARTSRARTSAATTDRSGRGWVTGWDANGVEALNETDANWPAHPTPAPATGHKDQRVTSPADDGCRNTAEFLRLRLRIPIREARRRLALAHQVLPANSLTGQPVPPLRTHLAAALAPTGSPAAAPAVSSHAATIITATLDRLQHHATPETLGHIEHHLTTAAKTADPDFLARVAQRWADTIDADGTEPAEEALRHTQGAFIRKPRHGLHHFEIFATTDQYEYLATVMNTATNPRTTQNRIWNETAQGPDLERRTRPQQQLDGLVSAVKAGLTTNRLPTTGGNRPQIIATINYQDLFPQLERRTTSTGKGTGNFAFTGPVAATTLRKIACDADIIPTLLGTHGEILHLGRKTRFFTPAQRLALTARDQGCAFPNCTIPAPWCEAHHITYWSEGGETTTNNGVLLCSHHHHLIHKEQWTIATRHGTPTFIPPPHIDPHQKPRQNHYFKPPPLPHPRE